ncbi:unnamed protein product, partial [Owenia fusiformis]
MHQRAILK